MSKCHCILPKRTNFFTSSTGENKNVQGSKVKLFTFPVKVSQNCFDSFNYSNQTGIHFLKFPFILDK